MYTLVLTGLSASLATLPDKIPAHVGRDIYSRNIPEVDRSIIQTYAAFQSAIAMAFCHKNGQDVEKARSD